MSTAPFANVLDPGNLAFPRLTPEQLERVRPYGKLRHVTAGEVLFDAGDSGIPVFVVLSGSMNILQPALPGYQLLVTHREGGFSGEYTMISGQHAMVRGEVAEAGEFLEISIENFRSMIAKDAELSELFMRIFILRRLELIAHGAGNAVLLGSSHSPATLRLREFLSRNGHPYQYVDLDTDARSQAMLDQFQVTVDEIPVVICNGRNILRNPTPAQLADCLGLNANVDESLVRDLIVVGAGPSGLAAAVYAASEGLNVLVIEAAAPGGQAGSSSRIENYLGFPTGISGNDLTGRALAQAQKFGANMMVARQATRLCCDRRPYQVQLDQGAALSTRAIVLAAGAQYNRLPIANLEKFEGLGIYYGATKIESQFCSNENIIVVGGGNSAGQAAVFLSESANKVYMLVRSSELSSTMSRYLIRRIEENPKIELHYQTEVVGADGSDHLERVTWKDKKTGETSTHDVRHLFIMTGASPRTEWLRGCLALDDKGFVKTGYDLDRLTLREMAWPLSRPPQILETSLPGVFAVGDIRSGNVKRVASAVGEGSIAIHLVHRALAEF
ncbi:MAG TPA: FAD-dependent oxidoreductase [Verrucomicrobiae bacterium]|jgi:thioredoxin reductase (NADPH)|nr:FAD-dependent oxidoreductase [Verrucomicrobiae bacterium]